MDLATVAVLQVVLARWTQQGGALYVPAAQREAFLEELLQALGGLHAENPRASH